MMHRCSSLPCTLACPGSLAEADAPYDPQHEWASEGDDLHHDSAEVIVGHIDVATVDPLVARVYKMWQQHSRGWHPRVEEEMIGTRLRGHPDAYALVDELDIDAVVDDWKFGYIHRDHRDQLLGYAALIHETHGADIIEANAYYPRLDILDTYTFCPDDYADLNTRLDKAEADAGKRYAPGDHCRYCRHREACVARTNRMHQGVQAMVGTDTTNLTPSKLVELWPQAKQLEKALDAYHAAVKQALQSGSINHGVHQLRMEYRTRERLIAHKAKQVVLETLPKDTWEKACTVGKGKLVTAVREGAPARGLKKVQAEREFLASLRAADAITTSQSEIVIYERRQADKECTGVAGATQSKGSS